MDLAPGSPVSHYTVERLLGRGGMGEVYLALDTRLGRRVALKLILPGVAADETSRARFDREARLAASLHHPNIATVHEIGEDRGRPFIVMEYVPGETLAARIASGPIPLDRVLAWAAQVADALEAARDAHIVNRDLKSCNIIVTPRGDVKILDFGLAKSVDVTAQADLTTAAHLSESGVALGTVPYMSPEQALGRPVDHRSDLFSFGVVVYEMLAGRRPFSGATGAETIDAILHETPSAIARYNDAVPDAVGRIVAKLLDKNPDQRYQTARDVCNDLQRVQRETSGGAQPFVSPVATAPAAIAPAGRRGLW